MQDRPFVLLAVLDAGLVIGIPSSLWPPGCSVLMKRAGRLGMGVTRRSCSEQDTPPHESGGVAPYCKEHIVNILARRVKLRVVVGVVVIVVL